ncbi:MAG TPA: radical SAM family heme chaperone HemW [Anaerolineaceae bacterium]|nr:radical SAM family heme chaperone HemW [Anaerolineaceae bacterium]HUM48701.1 radical SAM family heme chaperone HemW [Anaerolineaceae bacterium]
MLSIYVHVPFCVRRCLYCDFITYAGMQTWLPAYVEAAIKEIHWLGKSRGEIKEPAQTVYFGGGTPSLLSIGQVKALLAAVEMSFGLAENAEITLEANPGTLTFTYLQELRTIGVNRLSLGVQSFSDAELAQLGRIHTRAEALESILWAKQAGFENLSLDLIFGLPKQGIKAWECNLQEAIKIHPEHLSLYNLIVEEGTPFADQISKGEMPAPDEDIAADMYELTMDVLASAGYEQYEISSCAASPEFESRHNKAYWQMTPFIGVGVAAAGFAENFRTLNTPTIPEYIRRVSNQESTLPFPLSEANTERNNVESFTQMQETMMLGLRLTREGVSQAEFYRRFGQEMMQVFSQEITRLLDKGLVEWVILADGQHLRLTRRGRMLGNQAFMEFV